LRPKAILSLENLSLNYVKITRAGVEIGATTTVSNLLSIKNLPTALVQAARGIHGLALKEMATIGGNIFSPHQQEISQPHC
jgi:CO/xanthine dehydrogenase FAD-binding subunit